MKNDNVNNPKHYTQGGIETIDYIEAKELDFLEGNVVKYVTRHKLKGGVEDLRKAKFYLNKLINREEKINKKKNLIWMSKNYST